MAVSFVARCTDDEVARREQQRLFSTHTHCGVAIGAARPVPSGVAYFSAVRLRPRCSAPLASLYHARHTICVQLVHVETQSTFMRSEFRTGIQLSEPAKPKVRAQRQA
eukprot:COSAG02_NODE_2576_length_8498_cov_4.245386_3_plen_108_part_00